MTNKKTLIIVDMQKGFITKNNKFLVKNIENLIKSVKFDKIITTKFINKKDSQYVKFLNYSRLMEKDETDFAIKPPKNSIEVIKTSYGLPDISLVENDEVYICGTDYDSCVLSICFQLFDYGIQPKIIKNCVGSHSLNPIPFEDFEKMCRKNFGEKSIINS